ncbi:MAG: magnesium chelatase [Candidatus Schekmanbacteria bacterium]|nr:MAG: magnesium chelatase [Candidatus Schekmanbacteria bacterium]
MNKRIQKVKRTLYPFVAIVGQEDMKLALSLNAANPSIGGVLIRGEKGTGKSTAVRALAEILPEISVVKGCPFNCSPNGDSGLCPKCTSLLEKGEKFSVEKRKMKVVDLPLGVTEDRLIGSLDIESAIKEGKRDLEPGILAEVNGGILYVDEINLLDDHVVDVLLDAATSGINVVEREGISFSHPSKFILVGTMNPEEGELRPQLLDRIAIHIDVEGLRNVDDRVNITLLRNEFEKDPIAFNKKYSKQSDNLRKKIIRASKNIKSVQVNENALKLVCRLCQELEVEGHRPDSMVMKTAITLAAFRGRKKLTISDIKKAAKFILTFRIKRIPFKSEDHHINIIDEVIDRLSKEKGMKIG